MGDLHSVAITPFSTMGAGGPRLSMKNSMFNTVRSRIGIKTSETAAKRYGVATLLWTFPHNSQAKSSAIWVGAPTLVSDVMPCDRWLPGEAAGKCRVCVR